MPARNLPTHRVTSSLLIATTVSTLLALPAVAQPADGRWSIQIGAGGVARSAFEGSSKTIGTAFPLVSARYSDLLSVNARDGARLNVLSREIVGENFAGLSAGPLLRYEFGRDVDDDPTALRGLGDVDGAAMAGGFVAWQPAPFLRLRAEARQRLGDTSGVVVDVGADLLFKLSEHLSASIGPNVSWSNATYNRLYFGVTPAQAAASGYAVYTPGAGFRTAGVSGGLQWSLTEQLALVGFGSYGRLLGDAADSPIVLRNGSRDTFTIGAGATWRFGN
jgi:outer membrane scaffolding protein for murein synthesis (MipA/OmpV family)